ncbi:F-box DNA helicase 1-like isoform X2 [Orbicella faveolata]|uniref:F-box DNA helicase 1-like isoform X2 n=1 Tax=Orbicella faveolata TaxID=48498 RepID=UPI0009E50953|nr:F-box DNA helicase 1-like isoform X2 [Orbicella faveolata]
MRPMERFLNVAYNKSIQQHALKTFPSNVESRTIHSLAFRGVGFQYKHKLAFGLRISTIMNALPNECGYLHARRVEDTLKNFIASSDTTVQAKHVPRTNRVVVEVSLSEGSDIVQSIFGNHGADVTYLNSDKHIQKVVSHAEGLWQRMRDPRDKDFPITHDGYLKIYQLNRPVLDGYDCLLVDEAQDCTPAASDILLRQSCAKILVGDPHQQIYAFRGARNALQEVTSTHTFYLTQSFRFGPEIAYVASCVLDVLKGVRNKTLVGGAKRGSVMGEKSGQVCVITRCNYTLFNEAVNVCCANNNSKVGFVGGLQGLALDRVLDIHKLFTAGTNKPYLGINDALIKKFKSFSELKKYAKVAPDPELLGKIKIVETHHVLLQNRIEKIKSKAVANLQQADIIFSTAHKAKGLEFDTVRVTDDFLPGTDIGVAWSEHGEDEKNLVYVAVSRAKRCLQLNSTILGILGSRKPAICRSCKGEIDFTPRPHVVIQKEDITLGGNVKVAGGILCPSCALMKIPHLGCLAYVNVDSINSSSS